VKRHVAAAVAFVHFDLPLNKELSRHENIPGFGIAAKSYDRSVLKQQEHIAYLTIFSQLDHSPLEVKAGSVIDGAQLEDANQSFFPDLDLKPTEPQGT